MKYSAITFRVKQLLLTTAALFFLLLSQKSVLAQDQEGLTLSLRRNFGYSSGTGQIQGNFTARVTGPENLARVVFLIDGQEMGSAVEAPFELKFNTDNYILGVHTISAVGFTSDGQELQSNKQQREFVPAEEGWQTAGKIAIPIFGIVFLMLLVSFVAPIVLGRGRHGSRVPLGAPRNYGMLGGAICPKCERPFGMHIWGFNLVAGKFDRCPHCGRWSLVNRASMDALHAAEAAELKGHQPQPQAQTASLEEEIRKGLDDSRYQDL